MDGWMTCVDAVGEFQSLTEQSELGVMIVRDLIHPPAGRLLLGR